MLDKPCLVLAVCAFATAACQEAHTPAEDPSDAGTTFGPVAVGAQIDAAPVAIPSLSDAGAQASPGDAELLADAESLADAASVDAGDIAPADAAPTDAPDSPSAHPGKSFDDALRMEVGSGALLVDERSADQVDFFVFHAEAGKFYELKTDRRTFSPDNVLALYDDKQQLVAENDDGSLWPGDAIDTRLVFHAARDGDYYVRIEDLHTGPDFFESPFALLYYLLSLREVGEGTQGFVMAKGGGKADASFEHDDMSGYDHITLLGQVKSDTESFAFAGVADRALIGHVHPAGSAGDGSSFAGGRVRVVSEDSTVLAEIDRTMGQENIHPPLSDGQYTLELQAQGSALGDNPYYAVDLVMLPENPKEQAESANDTLDGAELVTLIGGNRRRGLLLSRLPPGDVDYYRFDLLEGDLLRASCEGESGGSGVRGLEAELRDGLDQRLESASESVVENLLVPQIAVDQAGTYYLRLAAGDTPPDQAVEPWVRCAVLVNQ